jgi:ribonuclease HI
MAVVVVDIWTDGSGTTRGHPGGWAYVLKAKHPTTGEVKVVEGSGHHFDTTNNRMEMTALLMALRALKRPSFVQVHSDSQYVIDPFRKGYLEKWEKKKWAKVKNVDLWLELKPEVARHLISWQWVRGHNGNKYNEVCDKLAGQARRHAIELLASNPQLGQRTPVASGLFGGNRLVD